MRKTRLLYKIISSALTFSLLFSEATPVFASDYKDTLQTSYAEGTVDGADTITLGEEEELHLSECRKISRGNLGEISIFGTKSHAMLDYMELDSDIAFNVSYGTNNSIYESYKIARNPNIYPLDDAVLKAVGNWYYNRQSNFSNPIDYESEVKKNYTLAQSYIWFTIANGRVPTLDDAEAFREACHIAKPVEKFNNAPVYFLKDIERYYDYYKNDNKAAIDQKFIKDVTATFYFTGKYASAMTAEPLLVSLSANEDALHFNKIKVSTLDLKTYTPLSGAVITLLKNDGETVIDTLVSDEFGEAESIDLLYGDSEEENTYYLKLTTSPNGYKEENYTQKVVLDSNNFYNEERFYYLEKEITNTGVVNFAITDNKENPLQGVKIELTHGEDNTVIDTVTTDAEGKAKSVITIPSEMDSMTVKATITEVPDGYKLPSMSTSLFIKAYTPLDVNLTVAKLLVPPTYLKASIAKIVLLDQHNAGIEGVTIKILDESTLDLLDTFITDEDGIGFSDEITIAEDKTTRNIIYAITNAPDGYIFSRELLRGKLKDGEIVEFPLSAYKVEKKNLIIKVQDENGKPIENAVLDVFESITDENALDTVTTNKDGLAIHECEFTEGDHKDRYVVVKSLPNGYELIDSKPSPASVDINASDEENTLVITFAPKTTIDITYILCDDEISPAVNNTKNPAFIQKGKALRFYAPTRDGYKFEGWYKDADYTEKITSIARTDDEDTTIYAKWSEITYTLKLNSNGGKFTEQFYANHTQTISKIPYTKVFNLPDETCLTRNGYVFTGWNTASNGKGKHYDTVASMVVGSSGTRPLYAEWAAIKYAITYHLNDNEDYPAFNFNPDFRTVTKNLNLKAPVRKGFTFNGWHDNAEFNGKVITSISKTFTEDKELYAKWTENTYKIKLSAGSKGTLSEQDSAFKSGVWVNYSDKIKLPAATATKEGYKFVGWNTKSNGSGDYYTYLKEYTGTNKGSVTLYAIYKTE